MRRQKIILLKRAVNFLALMVNYFLSKIRLWALRKSFLLSCRTGAIPPPKFVVWDCSRRCNLKCEHCGARKEEYQTEMATNKVKDLIKKLSESKVSYFMVTGGEPMLRADLLEIFSLAKKMGLRTGLATNGFLIDETKSPSIAAIFDSVQISLDGPEEIHDKIRGKKGAFAKAVGAVQLLRKNNCRQISLASVITPVNIQSLPELGGIVRQLEVASWKITTVMPIGVAAGNENLYLNRQEFWRLLNFVKERKKNLKIDFGENIGYLGGHDRAVRNAPFFCPVGFLACCVGVNGNVRGCPEQPDIPYFTEGNILEKDFLEIWRDGFQKYRQGHFLENEDCRKCALKNNCYGGCWVMKLKRINCPVRYYNL